MTPSKFLNINWRDVTHGFIVAAGAAAINVLQCSLSAGSLDINLKQLMVTALSAGLAYLAKKFFSPINQLNAAHK